MSHQEDPSGRKKCMPGPPPARQSGGGAGNLAPWADGALCATASTRERGGLFEGRLTGREVGL